MQFFSFLERRRSTASYSCPQSEVKDQVAKPSMLLRSASLIKARLTGTKRTDSPRESGRPVTCYIKEDLAPRSGSWRYSGSFVDFEEYLPKRKSSLKRLLRHLRSSSRGERLKTCNQEELTELAYLLKLKETENIQSVKAKKNIRVCQGNHRQSREVEIIDPSVAGWP